MVVFVEKQTFPEPPKDLIGFVQSVEQFLVVSVFLLYRFRGKLAPNKVNDSWLEFFKCLITMKSD